MDHIQLKVDLKGDDAEFFEKIKSIKGFKTNADTIRYIIQSAWEMENSTTVLFEVLKKPQIDLINQLLSRKDVQNKFFISDLPQFLQKAIDSYYYEIKKSCKSILHWDVKSRLMGDEKEIAIAFGHCQERNKNNEVTANDIARFLNKRNVKHIESILDSFVNQNLLEVMVINEKKLYHGTENID